jgi:hypothetical protein
VSNLAIDPVRAAAQTVALARLRWRRGAIGTVPVRGARSSASEMTASVIEAVAARVSDDEIAVALGVGSDELTAYLDGCAFTVTGARSLRRGDLVLLMDGEPARLVVRREFGALYHGGPRCLGIEYPTSTGFIYNLWESQLGALDRMQFRVVRASSV